MNKTMSIIVSIVIVAFSTICCQNGSSSSTQLSIDELPGIGETMNITSDTTIVIQESEKAVIGGLYISGTADVPTRVQITVNGELMMNGSITCDNANVTINNTGMLTMENTVISTAGNNIVSLSNYGTWNLHDFNIQTYGGHTIIANHGTMIAQNAYLKDQNDGTYIMNDGDATLTETTLVANGAFGAFEITNQGTMQLHHNMWDINYGGKIDINTMFGVLIISDSTIAVSGASHGQYSAVNILDGNTTWDQCLITNNAGRINYQTLGTVQMNDCTIVTEVNGSTGLANNGAITVTNVQVESRGITSIDNQGSFKAINSEFNASGVINLQNGGELIAENWYVRTTADNSSVFIMNMANITFNQPFIEGAASEELTSIGTSGKTFPQLSGGTVILENHGSITQLTSKSKDTDPILIYLMIFLILCIVILVLFGFLRKKK